MIKINANPVEPIITIKPLRLFWREPTDRVSAKFQAEKARVLVQSAINQYLYTDDSCGQNI